MSLQLRTDGIPIADRFKERESNKNRLNVFMDGDLASNIQNKTQRNRLFG